MVFPTFSWHYGNIFYQTAVCKVKRTLSQKLSRYPSNKIAVSRFVTRFRETGSRGQEKTGQLSALTAENLEDVPVWLLESPRKNLRELASYTHARARTHTHTHRHPTPVPRVLSGYFTCALIALGLAKYLKVGIEQCGYSVAGVFCLS
jgi:hypothetical protein